MMYMRNPEKEFAKLDLSPAMVIALVIAVLGTLQMGITPSRYLDLARQSILALM
jgi:NADH-quinone oxidoreductase subunit N